MSDDVTSTPATPEAPQVVKTSISDMPKEMWASMAFAQLYTNYKKQIGDKILSAEEECQAFFKTGVEFTADASKKLVKEALSEIFAEKNKVKDFTEEEEEAKMKTQIQMMENFIVGKIHQLIPPKANTAPVVTAEPSAIIQIQKPAVVSGPIIVP